MSDETGKRDANKVFQNQPQSTQSGLTAMHQGYDAMNESGYEVPVDVVPIPSKGVAYSEGTPLHNLQQVEIRAMTAKDEDILTSRALIKKGTVISHLIRSCLIDKNINPNQLLSGDRNAILVALRITGYGADYTIETECPACKHRDQNEFDLTELPIKWLELQPDGAGQNVFSVQLPVSGKQIKFRFLTGKDEEELALDLEMRKKKLKTQMDNLITSRLRRSIVAVDSREDGGYISQFIDMMPVGDSRFLRNYVEKNEPGIEMIGNIVCAECGEVSEVDVPIGASFFWPDA